MFPAVLALTFLSFSKKESVELPNEKEPIALVVNPVTNEVALPLLAHTVDTNELYTPLLKKDYFGFKAALGFKESRGKYKEVNTLGYMGKYQFGINTLALIGIYDAHEFLNNPALQEAAFYAYASRNKWVLRREIAQYVGSTIDGVEVTESGILAAAHLAGPGGVKKYLRSGGNWGVSDAFGTHIKHYMELFSHYDLSFIESNRYARAELPESLERPNA